MKCLNPNYQYAPRGMPTTVALYNRSSELPLFATADQTFWRPFSEEADNGLSISNVEYLSIAESENKLNKNRVYGLAGVLAKDYVVYYYLIITPNIKSPADVYFIPKSACTSTLNVNLTRNTLYQSHYVKQEILIVPDGRTFDFFLVQNPINTTGIKFFRKKGDYLAASEFWDSYVFDVELPKILSKKRNVKESKKLEVKRKLNDDDDNDVFFEDFTPKKKSELRAESHVIPMEVTNLLIAEKLCSNEKVPLRNMIRSRDSGGLNKVVSAVRTEVDLLADNAKVYLSDYHIATTVDGAYKTPHNQTTILAGLNKLESFLIANGHEKNSPSFKKAVGAVSDKFYEGIEHRMDPEKSVDHNFTDIKVDIDQVALRVFRYKLKNITDDYSKHTFLSSMYMMLLKSVILDEFLLHGQVPINFPSFSRTAKTGGHTYMPSSERGNYIALPTRGAMSEVFNVSVLFHDNRERGFQLKDVWDAVLYVTMWLETKGPKATAAQAARAKNLNLPGNTHLLCHGPMLPLLVSLYLSATTVNGVSIVMETYGGKTRETVRYVPHANLKVDPTDAQSIKELFTKSLRLNVPFLICRFSRFCGNLSHNKFFYDGGIHRNNVLKWGIGCTVQTVCKVRVNDSTDCDISAVTDSLLDDSFLSSIASPIGTAFSPQSIYSNSSFSCNVLNSSSSCFSQQSLNLSSPLSISTDKINFTNLLSTNRDISAVTDSLLDDSFLSSIASPIGTAFSPQSTNDSERCSVMDDRDYVRHFSLASADSFKMPTVKQDFIFSPAYTVVNVIPSSLLRYCDNPATWFMDDRGSKIRKEMSTANSNSRYVSCQSKCNDDENDDDNEGLDAEIDSNGLDTEESEYASTSASHRHSKESHNLNRFLALSGLYKDFVTFPIFGGVLPLSMQPSNHTRKGKGPGIVVPDTVSKRIYRIQQYSILARNAYGECGAPLRSTVEMAHYELDIFFDKSDSIFNLESLKEKRQRFEKYAEINLDNMKKDGNPARIEIAFESIDPDEHDTSLLNGIQDTLQMVLNSTKSYCAANCSEFIQFSLDGVLSRLHTLQDMMRTYYSEPSKHFELYHIRTEVAARLYSFYSGRGTLKNMHLFSPKNSYMASRPTHKMLMPLSHACREKVLRNTVLNVDLWEYFINNLIDKNGSSHRRIEVPEFHLQYVNEIVNDRYVCGRTCNKCWMIFATEQHIRAFECHDCIDLVKGKSLLITDAQFVRHHDKKLSELNDIQSDFISDVRHEGRVGDPPNIFITGGAGSGKTHVLKLSIANTLHRYGMNSFVVLAYTKMAASLVNGITYHSFLGMTGNANNDGNEDFDPRKIGDHLNGLKATVRLLQVQTTLRIIYIDEVGMLSNQQLQYLDDILRHIKKNKQPFGGIQIVLCGDVLQLPPIVENSALQRADHIFFFHSDAYKRGKFSTVYLEVSYRQKDKSFLKILNRMRQGDHTQDDLDIINTTWGSAVSYDSAKDVLTGLTTLYRQERRGELGSDKQRTIKSKMKSRYRNKYIENHSTEMDEVIKEFFKANLNSPNPLDFPIEKEQETSTTMTTLALEQMKRLNTNSTGSNTKFDFSIHNENLENKLVSNVYSTSRNANNQSFSKRICQAEDYLAGGGVVDADMKLFLERETKTENVFTAFVGMRVLFTANETSIFTSNNTMGIVTEIKCSPNGYVEAITVAPCVSIDLVPHPVVVLRKLHEEDYKGTQLARNQFPLKAADCGNGFTVQGCSLSIPLIYNSSRLQTQDVWARVYVAASRVTDKKYFFTLFPLQMGDIKPNPEALNFDRELRMYQRNKKLK